MCKINPTNKLLECELNPPQIGMRITDAYQEAIQDFSQTLFRKGWVIPSLIIPSIFGEIGETFRATVRRFIGWKEPWKTYGFFNAGDPVSLDQLCTSLKGNDPLKDKNPVLLFHGLFSSPDMWLPWADELKKASLQQKIGHVITLQLPNDMQQRMEMVFAAIDNVVRIYQEANLHKKVQVDLIGHSLGGYAAHLAAYRPEHVVIKDETQTERRWHSHHPDYRNDNVRKVISLGAATWLCCHGQHDETTICEPGKEDIYPWKVFSNKTVEHSYTKKQLEVIRSHHEGIYDFIGVHDGISPIISPLPKQQVLTFRHGHLGLATCPEVCKAAIAVLEGR